MAFLGEDKTSHVRAAALRCLHFLIKRGMCFSLVHERETANFSIVLKQAELSPDMQLKALQIFQKILVYKLCVADASELHKLIAIVENASSFQIFSSSYLTICILVDIWKQVVRAAEIRSIKVSSMSLPLQLVVLIMDRVTFLGKLCSDALVGEVKDLFNVLHLVVEEYSEMRLLVLDKIRLFVEYIVNMTNDLRKTDGAHKLLGVINYKGQRATVVRSEILDVVIKPVAKPELRQTECTMLNRSDQDICSLFEAYQLNHEDLMNELTWRTLSAQLKNSSKKNQIKWSSTERVIEFTNQVISSLPDIDMRAFIGRFPTNHEELSYKSTCYGTLAQQRSLSSWIHTKIHYGLKVIQLPNRRILDLPYLEPPIPFMDSDWFGSFENHIWRPGDYINQLEALRRLITRGINQSISRYKGDSTFHIWSQVHLSFNLQQLVYQECIKTHEFPYQEGAYYLPNQDHATPFASKPSISFVLHLIGQRLYFL